MNPKLSRVAPRKAGEALNAGAAGRPAPHLFKGGPGRGSDRRVLGAESPWK